MKKSVSYIAVLLLTVFAFGIAAFAHAGKLPASSAVFAADGSKYPGGQHGIRGHGPAGDDAGVYAGTNADNA